MRLDNLHLSRLTLRKSSEIAPLINVLQPAARSERTEVDHRLLWTAMPDDVQAGRSRGEASFLWRRDDKPGRYYVLGPEPRTDSAFFDVETKPFRANLAPGDRLQFILRVNATVDRRSGGRASRQRADVAMDLLRSDAGGGRAAKRNMLAEKAARNWLVARCQSDGFSLDALRLEGYRAMLVRRNPRRPGRLGIFDLQGLLTVTDPTAFLGRLASGFGRAKAFGCGLMLVRRAG